MKASLMFGPLQLELYAQRFLWIPSLRLMCVSDLHLEKGSFFSRFATFLPPYDSHDTLEKLEEAVARMNPHTLIALGDSFHDRHAGMRMEAPLKAQLNGLIKSIPQWIWITGNHDPEIDPSIEGRRMDEAAFGGIAFRHILQPEDDGFEISGHFHPKVATRVKGHAINGPCFVQSAKRLIMPSFGSYTGGLSVASQDFIRHVPQPADRIFLIYQEMIHSLSAGQR